VRTDGLPINHIASLEIRLPTESPEELDEAFRDHLGHIDGLTIGIYIIVGHVGRTSLWPL